MKKLILIFFPFLFVSCSVKHKKTFDYIFNKTEAITLEQSKLTLSKDITVLSFSDSSMVDRNSSIIKVDSGWIVYSKNSESSILSFTSDGQFSGYIGHRGNGPGEYTSVYDVVVNQKSKVLEVLSDGGIFCYTFGGDFLDKKEVTYPAFSFAIDDRQNYWFYVGNNTTYGDAKMICTDENIANVAYYLHQKSNMLPMVENNFGRNGEWLTFHESLNHDLYTIENGKLDLSYAMDFPNYKLPKKLHELSGMEVIAELQRSNYASIINYLENHDYIFLNVLLNNEGERIPEVYYWIISKNLQEEVIIKIDGGISAESYLFNTQYLSNDNKLYCLGYIWENKDMESFEENLNPSVVALEFNELFSKVR